MTNKQTGLHGSYERCSAKAQEIQERYVDDPVRQNEEMRKLYAEINFNPLRWLSSSASQSPIF